MATEDREDMLAYKCIYWHEYNVKIAVIKADTLQGAVYGWEELLQAEVAALVAVYQLTPEELEDILASPEGKLH